MSLLGSFRLERDGKVVRLSRRKVESLLSFLALYPESHSREELATLLWGESTDDHARHSLRTALDSLRSTLGDQILLADRAEVQLSPELDLWLDVREFDQLAKAKSSARTGGDDIANLLQAVALYRGELLTGYYHEWILPLRERLRGLQIETLLRITQYERSQSEFVRALEFAERVLIIDPSNERAHQHLMLSYIAMGKRQSALEQYLICERALRAELGVPPSDETTALYNWIKQTPSSSLGITARVTNLPIPLSSFVGRVKEQRELLGLLATARLVTMSGPGGSGKTRLAIQVATDLIDSFKDGVWWVVDDPGALTCARPLQTPRVA
ncbi:MAG TPA: BTAD domain-containing putative transcriptional regulator [Anaerolineae bacterium]